MSEIERRNPVELTAIADEIEREHSAAQDAFRSAVDHAIRCGELLSEAKASLPHGTWGDWLAENFPAGQRTAQGYMRLAENAEDAQRVSHLGIRGALDQLATPRLNEGKGDSGPPPLYADLDDEGWYSLTEPQRLHLHHLAQSIEARTAWLEQQALAKPEWDEPLRLEADTARADGVSEAFAHVLLYHLEHAPECAETFRLRGKAHRILAESAWKAAL